MRPDQIERKFDFELGISGDCLCLFSGCGDEYFEAWMLQGDEIESSWTRLFKVQENIIQGLTYLAKALCYTNSGKVVMHHNGIALLWYDPKENTLKSFKPLNYCLSACFRPVIIYIESLVSPNCCSATNI